MSNFRMLAVDGSPALRFGGGLRAHHCRKLVCYKMLHSNGKWPNNCWDYIST